jgi:hypothetical protein
MCRAVSPSGRVTPGSAFLKRATYRQFVESVATWLSKTRFDPATIGGCRVPEVVTLPYQFLVR